MLAAGELTEEVSASGLIAGGREGGRVAGEGGRLGGRG